VSKLFSLIRRDFRHVINNVVALVVCVGMIVIPCFYAWFNIYSAWDPYGNTGELKVALANADEGYKTKLMHANINIGERMVSDLQGSDKVDYVVTTKDKALEGVRSGEYYAAIVFPKDFSADMMTVLSKSVRHAKVIYAVNEKKNAIGTIVTGKVSTAVQNSIDQSFDQSLTEVLAGVLSDLSGTLTDEETLNLVTRLDSILGDGAQDLRGVAANVDSYQALVASTGSLLQNSDAMLSSAAKSGDGAGDLMRTTSSGVRKLDGAVDGATTSINDALRKSASTFDDVKSAIDTAYATAGGSTQKLRGALVDVKAEVDARRANLRDFQAKLNGTDTIAADWEVRLDKNGQTYDSVHNFRITIDGLGKRVDSAANDLEDLSNGIQSTIDDIDRSKGDADASKAELEALAERAKGSVTGVQASYEQGLKGSLGRLADTIDGAASDADALVGKFSSTMADVSDTTSGTLRGLSKIEGDLGTTAKKLRDGADKLDSMRGTVKAAIDSGDMQTIRTILSAGPTSLAEFVSSPVQTDRVAIYPVANNGSAMAPFYTTLAIWVGGVVLCALVRCNPSEAAIRETGAKPRHAYFGRLTFFLIIGFMQSSLVLLGDLFFIRIQCLHPWLFLLCGWFASLVFINIIFSLTAAFGDVGKAIAVLLMVIQVAGSGGTFPPQMLPKAFQAVYPFLPFVHAEKAMRCAIAGLFGADYWLAMGRLALFLVPSLLLGLLLRKPVVRLNHWIEEKIESTKLM
jgi:putative membrane protein